MKSWQIEFYRNMALSNECPILSNIKVGFAITRGYRMYERYIFYKY